ncbi:MAG: BolA family protein [Alphaproteobacteria bacterium]
MIQELAQKPSVEAQINGILTEKFNPVHLQIENQSHMHAHHAGSPNTGESHFDVMIVAAIFEGQNRIMRQKAVYAALDQLLKDKIHALSLRCLTPQESTPEK